MDDSLFYNLQNENIAKDAEIAALKRNIDELKERLEKDNLDDMLANPEVGTRVWYVYPLYDFCMQRIVWEYAGDHKFFSERNDVCILYWVDKYGNQRFKAVKSDCVFEEEEYAEMYCGKLNKRDKNKTYEEWKGVRDAYNPKFPA